MDKIIINNMEFSAKHGCNEIEKTDFQLFQIDLIVFVDLSKPSQNDKLSNTIDYSTLYKIVEDVVVNNTFNLIERLGQAIADQIFNNFIINKLSITIRKPNVDIGGLFDNIAIQIEREYNE